jgi:hypothetical protein
MPERAWQWLNRIMFGKNHTAPLDWGQELWKWDVSLYGSAPAVVASIARSGRPVDDDAVLFEATRSLLFDVVDAAGGVEYAHECLHQAMALAVETYVQWSSDRGEMVDGTGMSHPSLEAAWYSLEEMLTWARTLDDRLKRDPVGGERYNQGLIPALAEGPRREEIVDARARLRSPYLNEARYLSSLSLHMQSSQAGSKGGRVRGGQLILQFPDPVTNRIDHSGS